METIGDRVRRLRESKGIERKDLAREVDLSYTGLSDLESGKAKSSTRLHRIAEALGVSAAYLETGKDSHRVNPLPDRHSQPMRLDPAMLAETAKALRLRFAKTGGYSLEADPELFAMVYEMRLGMSDAYVSPEVFELVIQHADLTPQGAGNNGRSNGAPTHGADERKAGGSRPKG
jgi:transcriptional regulator with XRE-family HTH domain